MSTPAQVTDELRALRNKRGQVKGTCTRTLKFVTSLSPGSAPSLEVLSLRREEFKKSLGEFNSFQSDIEVLSDAIDDDERDAFETAYYEVLDAFVAAFQRLAPSHSPVDSLPSDAANGMSVRSSIPVRVQLPRIDLPSFSGAYEDWYSFKNTFEALIHRDESLSAVQKFHYLKACLKGSAAAVIQALDISETSYAEAWSLLMVRFDDKQLIVQRHAKALFELPTLTKEDHGGLRHLLDGYLRHSRALKSMAADTKDVLIVQLLVGKLDHTTTKEWEMSRKQDGIPTAEDLLDFLTRRCHILESVAKSRVASVLPPVKGAAKGTTAHVVSLASKCQCCKGDHDISRCFRFAKLTLDEKSRVVRDARLCYKCLAADGHRAWNCVGNNCKKCGKRHHTLLHREETHPAASSEGQQEQAVSPRRQEAASATEAPSGSRASFCTSVGESFETLLPTAAVCVDDGEGRSRVCRALLDSGSQTNFISQKLVDQLGLKTRSTNIPVYGIGLASTQVHRKTRVVVKSRYNGFRTEMDCLILPKITDRIPSVPLNPSAVDIPKSVKLADPEYHSSAPVDLLIGAGVFWDTLCVGQVRKGPNQPLLQKTLFGWIIGGNCRTGNIASVAVSGIARPDSVLDERLERFWQVEQCGPRTCLTREESQCEDSFAASVTRTSEGRYVVKLPVQEAKLRLLTDSRGIACKRLFSLERRLKKNPDVRDEYVEFLREYHRLGHMKRVDVEQDPVGTIAFYLPHHEVLKQSSLTTKLRVVFDASCPSRSGVSLNDALLAGPVLQQDLFSIISRFRIWRYVLNADIAKMYRQVLIQEDQRCLQRILWRESSNEAIQTFELSTVTYGTIPASYLAVRALHQLADDEGSRYPIGAAVTRSDFYMDDLLTGANTLDEAREIRDETRGLLAKGGFELRKWSSNCQDLLDGLSGGAANDPVLILDSAGDVSTLGVKWEPGNDIFRYEVSECASATRVTKRVILSRIARIFDPLGLLGPIIVTAKILMQRIWSLKIGWDESVPFDVQTTWLDYESQLTGINDIATPRRVIACDEPAQIQLHGFCDASEVAYGACVYVRVTSADGSHSVRLFAAKSRVAPLKTVSLPRLELCGAVLLSRLMDKVLKASKLKPGAVKYWTDSTIVLGWLRASARKWCTFVANRVGEIQELTAVEDWGHVSTSQNPADLLSRGASAAKLLEADIWWEGPEWLQLEQSCWPQVTSPGAVELPEQRRSCLVATGVQVDSSIFDRCSSLRKLTRIVAYCKRFARNSRSPSDQRVSGRLSLIELREATFTLVRLVQRSEFREEIRALQAKRDLPSNSRLMSLNPFLDDQGVLRVGGRLRKSQLPYAFKHPMVLPSGHPFTSMVISQTHEEMLHAGPQATLAAVRRQYWPLSGRGAVRRVLGRCFRCCRASPPTSRQIMGDLPAGRIVPSRPFAKTGVDFAGPFQVKESKRRNARLSKIYVAVFICFTTKAVHLEVVHDLTSEAFIGALKRFVARRGKPKEFSSDNGTNFVGAAKELRELREAFQAQKVRDGVLHFLDGEAISWHFIPPRAPHFGGLWEAAVKSMKYHLRRVAGQASLTSEEMLTLLAQIEAVLNSRPISPLSEDPSDLCALTPGHFLIGDALTAPLEPGLTDVQENRLSRWQRVEQLKQHFWLRWSKEYLHQLQQRPKWARSSGRQLEVGQLVVVREDDSPPLRWAMARVELLHPGSDGVVRAATVRTASGQFKRPAAKLCILPT